MASVTPQSMNLQRDRQLEIVWSDGQRSSYSIDYLRSMCPCAACKVVRQDQKPAKSLLTVLPGNYAQPLAVVNAELVGNYALRITWSDDHATGIYSFDYLREIAKK